MSPVIFIPRIVDRISNWDPAGPCVFLTCKEALDALQELAEPAEFWDNPHREPFRSQDTISFILHEEKCVLPEEAGAGLPGEEACVGVEG